MDERYVAAGSPALAEEAQVARGQRRLVRRAALAVVGLATLTFAAPAAASDVYVTNQNSDNVSQYDVGAAGALAAKAPPAVPAGRPRPGSR